MNPPCARPAHPAFPAWEISSQNTSWHGLVEILGCFQSHPIAFGLVDFFGFYMVYQSSCMPSNNKSCLVEVGLEDRVILPAT
jgi:hypothetical protein